MKSSYRYIAIVIFFLVSAFQGASALSLSLDSVAEWGKFPRFCVNTYRWGDKFFNSYDSLYVVGTGTKFNVKFTTDSFMNYYRFMIPDNTANPADRNMQYVDLVSDPSTSVGVYLTYLAVSVGYDINVRHIFDGVKDARSRYQFGFNCSLLGVEAYIESNEVGTKMTRFGGFKNLDIPFNGIDAKSWGIDAYYFFNHKKYSQAAAFSFGKIQRRSQGSFYAGISVYSQNYDFDFSSLNVELLGRLPADWNDYHYRVKTTNYGFRLGYGYNWVFARNWTLGITLSPTIGFKKGFVNSETEETTFSMFNRAKLSLVWNKGRWFVGAVGSADTAMVSSRKTLFLGNTISATASVGYRFNIW